MKQKVGHTFIPEISSLFKQLQAQDLPEQMLTLFKDRALIITDAKQCIVYLNNTAVELLQLETSQGIGIAIGEVLKISDIGQIQGGTLKTNKTDDELLEVLIETRCFHNDQNQIEGWILVLDVPEKTNVAAQSNKNKINFHGILSQSATMRPVYQIIQNAAQTESTVLVRGESGSGKELVAKAIHNLSPRSKQPFLAINCAALSTTLLESELFGHAKGAFTGAINDHAGLFQRAHGGTLFLDEVAEIPMQLQAKLLRVLQEKNFIPVGGNNSIDIDVRIVAATHRSLREEVKNGKFRADLMYRLRVVPIFIPSLRERREDIHLLLWHFIGINNAKDLRNIDKIEPQAMQVLLDHPWPGNIRELQNVLEYAFAVGRGSILRLSELPPEFREPTITVNTTDSEFQVMSAEQEMKSIRQALHQCNGKISPAARLLGMSRSKFWRKRRQYEI